MKKKLPIPLWTLTFCVLSFIPTTYKYIYLYFWGLYKQKFEVKPHTLSVLPEVKESCIPYKICLYYHAHHTQVNLLLFQLLVYLVLHLFLMSLNAYKAWIIYKVSESSLYAKFKKNQITCQYWCYHLIYIEKSYTRVFKCYSSTARSSWMGTMNKNLSSSGCGC